MTTPEEVPAPDRRARYAASFFDGVRYSCAHHEHYGWTRAEAERTVAMCDRIERLGLPAAWLVVKLCCGGREPLRFDEAVATVEAICQPAEITEPSW